MKIRYLQRSEIDIVRWDNCLHKSENSRIYAYSFYLDAMASNWDGLVLDDYAAIMPLPWRKKWGIYYLYQPFLTAQLGVFGKELNKEIVDAFLQCIPAKFKLLEFPLNTGNLLRQSATNFILRKNYILSLNDLVDTLVLQYKEQTKRNIKKAKKQGIRIHKNIPVDDVVQLTKQHGFINKRDVPFLNHFKDLYLSLERQHRAETYGVYSKENMLVASAAFLFTHNRAYYLLVANTPEGRATGASHFLIHSFIKDHAGTPLTLDFEGSDVESIAFFYSGFGAIPELYPAVRLNRLPFYLKWLKKS